MSYILTKTYCFLVGLLKYLCPFGTIRRYGLNDIWIWKHRNYIFFHIISILFSYLKVVFSSISFYMYYFYFLNENVKLAGMQLGMFFMFSACFLLKYHVFVKLWQYNCFWITKLNSFLISTVLCNHHVHSFCCLC